MFVLICYVLRYVNIMFVVILHTFVPQFILCNNIVGHLTCISIDFAAFVPCCKMRVMNVYCLLQNYSTDLFFGIFQDVTAYRMLSDIKDSLDSVVTHSGQVFCTKLYQKLDFKNRNKIEIDQYHESSPCLRRQF